MTKQEYNDYIEALKARGYKLGDNGNNDKIYCSKTIEYRKDKDGDSRAACVLRFYLYDKNAIEPVVMVSRNTDEPQYYTIISPTPSIEECERIAKEFLRWVDVNVYIE